MHEEKEELRIEIHSEKIDEILGKSPNWILRRGVLVLVFIVLTLFGSSWLFRYPDIISAPIVITSNCPPSLVVARNDGRIIAFFVTEKQVVKEGQYLAVLESTSNIEAINQLRSLIVKISLLGDSACNIDLNSTIISNLGVIQQPYLNWVNSVISYQRYAELSFNAEKIKILQEQISLTNSFLEKLRGQNYLQLQNLGIAIGQFKRDSILFLQNIITPSEFESAEVELINAKSAHKISELALCNTLIQKSQLNQQIIELRLNDENEQHKLICEINTAFKSLRSQFLAWEFAYVLKSKIDGIVSIGKYWSTNQNVKPGELVMTVLSQKSNLPLGKLRLPMVGAGKVKIDQRVNIKLDNFPYIEYGMLKGKISSISSVPDQGNYYVEIELTNGLTTNYNKELPFSQEMTGNADIITDDIRLLERLIGPIYSLIREKFMV